MILKKYCLIVVDHRRIAYKLNDGKNNQIVGRSMTDFEDVARAIGWSPLDRSRYNAMILERAEMSLKNLGFRVKELLGQSTVGRDFYYGYLQSEATNAKAMSQGVDVIGVNIGVLLQLMDVAYKLGSKDLLFPWIPRLENGKPSFEGVATFHFFIECGMHSIFLHEVGHIAMGHCAYASQVKGLKSLIEIEAMPEAHLENPIGYFRQCFEAEADQYSVVHLVRAVQINGEPCANPDWEARFGRYATRMMIAFCASYLIMRSFNQASGPQLDLSSAYPPIQIRQRIIMEQFLTTMTANGMLEEDQAFAFSREAVTFAELMYSQIRDQEYDESRFARAWTDEANEYMERLTERKREMREALKPFVRPETFRDMAHGSHTPASL